MEREKGDRDGNPENRHFAERSKYGVYTLLRMHEACHDVSL